MFVIFHIAWVYKMTREETDQKRKVVCLVVWDNMKRMLMSILLLAALAHIGNAAPPGTLCSRFPSSSFCLPSSQNSVQQNSPMIDSGAGLQSVPSGSSGQTSFGQLPQPAPAPAPARPRPLLGNMFGGGGGGGSRNSASSASNGLPNNFGPFGGSPIGVGQGAQVGNLAGYSRGANIDPLGGRVMGGTSVNAVGLPISVGRGVDFSGVMPNFLGNLGILGGRRRRSVTH